MPSTRLSLVVIIYRKWLSLIMMLWIIFLASPLYFIMSMCYLVKKCLYWVFLTSKGYVTLLSHDSYRPFLCNVVLNTCWIFNHRCYHSVVFKRPSLHKFCKVYKGPFIRDAALCYSLWWVWMYTFVFAGQLNIFQRCVNS